MTRRLTLFTDYKSPYAYLAKEPAYELERDFDVVIDWLPYTLDIPSYLGSARVDEKGETVEETRTAHEWRRVRYSYMDCRRDANRAGLVIRGPRKIFDSSLANIAMMYAIDHGVFRPYHDMTFERFWKRELDIEDREVVRAVLKEAGAEVAAFFDYLDGDGRRAHDRIRAKAEADGVFGVPSFVLDGELFWGREHLPLIRELLAR